MRLLLVLFTLFHVSSVLAIGAEQCALRGQLGERSILLKNINVTPPVYGLIDSKQYGYCEMDSGFSQLQCSTSQSEKPVIIYALDQENMDQQAYHCTAACDAGVVKVFVMECEG